MRIYREEFNDENSSNSEGADEDPLTELDYAFMYGDYFDEGEPRSAETINN